jgi:hypothetical protein
MKFLHFLGALTWGATHDPDFRYWQAIKLKFFREKWLNYDPYSVRHEFAGNFGIYYSVSELPADWFQEEEEGVFPS